MTAVEWLIDALTFKTSEGIYTTDGTDNVSELVEQAKAMEKYQIFKSYDDGNQNRYNAIYIKGYENINEEEYYEKNFKS